MNDHVPINHSSDKRKPLENILPIGSQTLLVEKLEHFSVYSDRLIVLLGDEGSGKSTIVNRLARVLKKPIEVLQASCQNADWLAQLLSQYGIQSTAAQRSFQFGMSQLNPDKDTVVILDDAELLDIEQVELLVEKVRDDNFHCVLAMNNDARVLKWLIEYPESVIFHETIPLETSESRGLLISFLHESIADPENTMDKVELEQIIDHSQGNPAKVKLAADSVLLAINGAGSLEDSQGYSINKLLIGAGSIVLALLLITVLLFQDEINKEVFTAKEIALVSPDKDNQLAPSDNPFVEEKDILDSNEQVSGAANGDTDLIDKPFVSNDLVDSNNSKEQPSKVDGNDASLDSLEELSKLDASETDQSKTVEFEISEPEKIYSKSFSPTEDIVLNKSANSNGPDNLSETAVISLKGHQAQHSSEIDKSQQNTDSVKKLMVDTGSANLEAVRSNNETLQSAEDNSTPLSDKPDARVEKNLSKYSETTNLNNNSKVIPNTKTATNSVLNADNISENQSDTGLQKAVSEVESLSGTLSNNLETIASDLYIEKPIATLNDRELLFLNESDNDWVLQLGSFNVSANAVSYAEKHNSFKLLNVYRIERNKKIWYIVVSHAYASKTEASNHRDEWQKQFPSVKPWLRPVKSVKQDISRFQNMN